MQLKGRGMYFSQLGVFLAEGTPFIAEDHTALSATYQSTGSCQRVLPPTSKDCSVAAGLCHSAHSIELDREYLLLSIPFSLLMLKFTCAQRMKEARRPCRVVYIGSPS